MDVTPLRTRPNTGGGGHAYKVSDTIHILIYMHATYNTTFK